MNCFQTPSCWGPDWVFLRQTKTPTNLIGFIHSHPGHETGRPSAADWDLFNDYYNWLGETGGHPDRLTMYIVELDTRYSPPRYSVFAYGKDDKLGTDRGPEVNPDAEPCSS